MRCTLTIYNDNATDGVDVEVLVLRRNGKDPEHELLKPTCDGRSDRGPKGLDINSGDLVLIRIPE